ncbi:MAG: GDP-L-fucose synthase family protein [Rhodothermaceae bacterium]
MPTTKKEKIFIAGHNGMVGRSIIGKYINDSDFDLVTINRNEVDLRDQQKVNMFFERNKPTMVIIAAAKVGGIFANNKYRAEFIYDNLLIEANIIHSAFINNCKKLLFLGSSCIYPKNCVQPIKEEYLLSGKLEYTNEPYAIAKIAGIKLCENYFKQYGCNFISVMPTNLYGPYDNFDLQHSHVLPALVRKIHDAKINKLDKVTIWGSGLPQREFLFVNDLADACRFVMDNVDAESLYNNDITHLNIGTGVDCSIKELAVTIKNIIGFEGDFEYDTSKPDGTSKKVLDVKRMKDLGWSSTIQLNDGIRRTYAWYLENKEWADERKQKL